jgi:hypothetical protein
MVIKLANTNRFISIHVGGRNLLALWEKIETIYMPKQPVLLPNIFPIPGDLFFVVLETPNFIVFSTSVAHAKSRS